MCDGVLRFAYVRRRRGSTMRRPIIADRCYVRTSHSTARYITSAWRLHARPVSEMAHWLQC